jgi:glycosyltransferase involved in cell wall biosynthesis
MNFEFVSFIIPVYNVESDILLKSLKSVSRQSHKSFEAIIVDDSTDYFCSKICSDFCSGDDRFKYIKPTHRLGLVKALNFGISLAKYDLIARFDSDDICVDNRIELQLDFLKKNKHIDILGGFIEVIDRFDQKMFLRKYPCSHNEISKSIHIECPIAHPSVIIKKTVFDRVGGYDESFKFAEDIDLWLRCLYSGAKFSNMDLPIVRYRQIDTIRNKQHYYYFLKARLTNFKIQYFPFNVYGIVLLIFANLMPMFFLRIYYKKKYTNKW